MPRKEAGVSAVPPPVFVSLQDLLQKKERSREEVLHRWGAAVDPADAAPADPGAGGAGDTGAAGGMRRLDQE